MKNMFIISPSYNTSNKEENPAKYSHEPKYSISNLQKIVGKIKTQAQCHKKGATFKSFYDFSYEV